MTKPSTQESVFTSVRLRLDVEVQYTGRTAREAIKEAMRMIANQIPGGVGPSMYDAAGYVTVRVLVAGGDPCRTARGGPHEAL